jgi:hypothetical protein
MARAPQPIDPTQDSVVLNQFTGLKNTVGSERLAPNELEKALNIDIDDAGQIRRRRGQTLVSSGNFHSVWTGRHAVYGVKNGALGIINPNYTFVQLMAGAGDAPIAYLQLDDDVYFSSEDVSGIIRQNGTISPWGSSTSEGTWLSPVVNPTETLNPTGGKMLGKPPMATALAYLNGRIYLAHDKTVWATELYMYNYVDKTRNFLPFEAEVTAIGAVTDGLYVGTKDNIWFLSGPLMEMRRIPVNGGIIAGSLVYIQPEFLPDDVAQGTRNAVLFVTPFGLFAGLDSGTVRSLTSAKFIFPDASSYASLFRRQDGVNQYIGVADSAGAPTSSARVGDYVDAEIRRFQGA